MGESEKKFRVLSHEEKAAAMKQVHDWIVDGHLKPAPGTILTDMPAKATRAERVNMSSFPCFTGEDEEKYNALLVVMDQRDAMMALYRHDPEGKIVPTVEQAQALLKRGAAGQKACSLPGSFMDADGARGTAKAELVNKPNEDLSCTPQPNRPTVDKDITYPSKPEMQQVSALAENRPQREFSPKERQIIESLKRGQGWVRISELSINEKQFQFRRSTTPEISVWNYKYAGMILVWRDMQGEIGPVGKVYVTDGHIRILSAKLLNDAAKAKGQPLPVPIIRVEYLPEGLTAVEAHVFSVMHNITSSFDPDPVDVAKFLRETNLPPVGIYNLLVENGIDPSGYRKPLLDNAMNLASLPAEIFDEIYQMNDEQASEAAAIIGKILKNPADIALLWNDVAQDVRAKRDVYLDEVQAQADTLGAARRAQEHTGMLFDEKKFRVPSQEEKEETMQDIHDWILAGHLKPAPGTIITDLPPKPIRADKRKHNK